MPALSVRLLGPLCVRSADSTIDRPAALKAQELLCYLLLHRDRAIRRDALSYLLWADLDARRCRKNLRQALWQLQSAIGPVAANDILDVAADTITLRTTADLWLDLAEFQVAVEYMRGISTPCLGGADAAVADRAVQLYGGDLLEGFDFDWCLVEREWIKCAYLMLLDKLMVNCEANGDYDSGIEYGERVLRCDRAREYTHRRLMCLHYLRGDRTGALRQYARCVQVLEEDLAVAPADSTALLCEQIRAGRGPDLIIASVHPPRRTGRRENLRRLQQALADLQVQVRAEIIALESAPLSLRRESAPPE